MRIRAVEIAWFRGAADAVSLEAEGKSIVVYGENGAGKSSFIDAVEYVISGGKIGHLSHEQSGKRQERAIPNTHTPDGKKAEFAIKFVDASELKFAISRDGSASKSGASTAGIETWDYRRTILRQDEVARFIQNTKGEKYSALLPLLGLQHLEIAAENLRKLARAVETESHVKELKGALVEVDKKRKAVFSTADNAEILEKVRGLYERYCPTEAVPARPIDLCSKLKTVIDGLIANSSANQKQHLILKDIGGSAIDALIAKVRLASEKLTSAVEPLIAEKLQLLESAAVFASKLSKEGKIKCPACGSEVNTGQFRAHVDNERVRLGEIISTFNERKESVGQLCDEIQALKAALSRAEIKSWRDEAAADLDANFTQVDAFNVGALRGSCGEGDLKAIEGVVLTIIACAAAAAGTAPTEVQQLTADTQIIDVASAVFESKEKVTLVADVGVLTSFIAALEEEVREEIAEKSELVIEEISKDIQQMWEIVHPGEQIDDVRLHVPEGTDKAIDICLRFHGIDQDSPRLTLSEGFRNSLGLCIFLAMAKREFSLDRPVFLDDVVVSVDRNHRGMIVDLFEKVFSGRQIIVLTHDRDWFIELKQRLQGGNWSFKALMPYEHPTTGIRWSAKTFGFDDARKLLDGDPDLAGNTARKIMDVELASRAEKLRTRMPYLHRERNDHRVAHEFLSQLVSDSEKAFQRKKAAPAKGDGDYEKNLEAIEAFRAADKLLVAWANKASHSFDVAKQEALKLIEACEAALSVMDCANCSKPVSKYDDSNAEVMQCGCGHIRWRYGKS